MSVGPLALELIIVFCLAVFLLHHYGNITKQHPLVTFVTLTAWYFSLIIVFILPLDVSSTFYRQCQNMSEENEVEVVENKTIKGSNYTQNATSNGTDDDTVKDVSDKYCEMPWSYVPSYTLPIMWRIVYWTAQCLTWVILPFMQSYSWSGQFSTAGKIKHALIKNAVYYGTYLLIFIVLLIYVATRRDITLNFSQLKVIGITASNTWGLFLLVLLLGYGLVEVPRTVWRAANPVLMMSYVHFKLAKLSTEKQEASETMEDILEDVKRNSEAIRYNHPLRKYVNTIIAKCPDEFQDKISQGMDDYVEYEDQRHGQENVTEKSLVRLHTRVIDAAQMKKRTVIQWKILMDKAIHLDTVVKNIRNGDGLWVDSPVIDKRKLPFFCTPTLKWYWECKIRPILLKISAFCLMILSLMVVWSECTFFNAKPVLSLFAIFINLAKTSYSYFYIELACFATISYLCICAYYTIFRMKIFNIYYIAGHHQTNEPSLMFVGIMLCRLTPPMCLNFLGLIHLDTHISSFTNIETSYTQIMGHLDVIPIISNGFNIYFPMLVVLLCIVTYFSLGHRLLAFIGYEQFIDGNVKGEFTADFVEEGKQLVNRELRRQEREIKSSNRIQMHGTTSDISTRQWQGRSMREVEDKHLQSMRTNDKVELLSDTEPLDYSSVRGEQSANTSDSFSERDSGSRWASSRNWSTQRVTAKRPPKNIFDDV
uniref:G-protein coupled receptor-associated protein LMBRD2-like n=1 Tax=Styela clava TaxID=7725 RepID=UPI001939AD36|nr:G-protein coupled receptor-associated protein LMBRD2-like [Styela clava]